MNWRTFLIVLWLAACFILGTIAFQRAGSSQSFWGMSAVGGTFGAVGLVAAWLVFGQLPLTFRIGGTAIGVFAFSAILCTISRGREANPSFWLTFHGSQVIVMAAGLMLFRRRHLRLRRPGDAAHALETMELTPQQFSLAALMAMIAGIGILLAILRWVLFRHPGSIELAAIGAFFGGVGVAAVALAWMRGLVVLRCAMGAAISVAIVVGMSRETLVNVSPAIIARLSLAMLLFMTASLAVFRVCGYRLERPRSPNCEPPAVLGESELEPASLAMPAASKL